MKEHSPNVLFSCTQKLQLWGFLRQTSACGVCYMLESVMLSMGCFSLLLSLSLFITSLSSLDFAYLSHNQEFEFNVMHIYDNYLIIMFHIITKILITQSREFKHSVCRGNCLSSVAKMKLCIFPPFISEEDVGQLMDSSLTFPFIMSTFYEKSCQHGVFQNQKKIKQNDIGHKINALVCRRNVDFLNFRTTSFFSLKDIYFIGSRAYD